MFNSIKNWFRKNSIDKYDRYFEDYKIEKGIEYYNNNEFSNFKLEGSRYYCEVGKDYKYYVYLEVDDYGINYMTCTCRYFNERDGSIGCEHIYALLSKICNGKNIVYDIEDEEEEENKVIEDNNSEYTKEELMNDYGLEDWQADLVLSGEYDPWNFDEQDLEEDDYYYEDGYDPDVDD